MAKLYIGTSGFYYKHWLASFYPPGIKKEDLLSYYASRFNTVEINSSFYHLPQAKTVANWYAKVPQDFVFVFKAWRRITHLKKLKPTADDLDIFFDRISSNRKEQLVLFQTPANLKANRERLEQLLQQLPNNFRYAFEFRHPTWFSKDIYQVLKNYNICLVLSDSPRKALLLPNQSEKRLWPYVDIDTANLFYIRFHGTPHLYASSYNDKTLKSYAQLIKTKLNNNQDVYCYFNNDIAGHAAENAITLRSSF